jgi:hypothetical protein
MSSNIRAMVRVRPLSDKEFAEKQTEVLQQPNAEQIGVDGQFFTFDKVFYGVTQRGACARGCRARPRPRPRALTTGAAQRCTTPRSRNCL